MLDPDMAQRTITLMAPSKTYNIPGLGCPFAVIPDASLRHRFTRVMNGIVPDVNVLGLVATEAAFTECEAWHEALLAVLRRNRDRVQEVVSRIPGLSMSPVEATYPAWFDARARPGKPGCVSSRRTALACRKVPISSAGLAAAQFRLPARDAGGRAATHGFRLFQADGIGYPEMMLAYRRQLI